MIRSSVCDGLCVLRLNTPPLSFMGAPLLHQLQEHLGRAAADGDVRAIVITGRPDHLSHGADLRLFQHLESAEDAVRISRIFQEAFQAVEDCSKPVAVALAGDVSGCALELAAACHLRVACPGTRFSMPEVGLGFNPLAGGTQRLPRLLGLAAALRMLLGAQALDAHEAQRLGLLDDVAAEADLIESARALLAMRPSPRPTRLRTDKLGDWAATAAGLAEAAERIARGRPEIIAPRMILEAVRAGLEQSFAAGLEFEQAAFAECIGTVPAQSKIYLHFARELAGKEPAAVESPSAPDVARVAVIGMGTMGAGIAQALATAGLTTVVRDEEERFLESGVGRIKASLDKRAGQGKLGGAEAAAILGRLTATTRWDAIAGADLVIEAVPEELALKRAVLARAEHQCPDAILATNTSTLSLDELSAGLRRPERLLGLHFFNPAHHMPLVEVIRRDQTPPGVVAAGLGLVRRLGKTPVLVRNREGFVVNRLFMPYLHEAFLLLAEGVEPAAIDRAMVEFGMPMGPLAVSDLTGLDIVCHAQKVLAAAFAHHADPSPIVTRLVDRGDLGQKTGAGVYRYERGDRTPRANPAAAEIVAAAGARPGHAGLRREEVVQRLVLRMVCEALDLVAEGVVQRESDADVATVLGIGFPDFRGGPICYARTLGLDHVRAELENFADRFGPRYRPGRFPVEIQGAD